MYDIDERIPSKTEFGRSLYNEKKLTRPCPFGASDPGYGFQYAARRLGGGGSLYFRTYKKCNDNCW